MHFYFDRHTFRGYDFPVISDNFSDTYMMRVILVIGECADRASACTNSYGDTHLTHIWKIYKTMNHEFIIYQLVKDISVQMAMNSH